jgi:hypothetical protein
MAYHYLNVIDEDNITILKDKFNIHPKVIYYIGYTGNNIINDDIHEYFLNKDILLNKIEQTIEIPDLIIINHNIDRIFYFFFNSEIIIKQTKYIIVKYNINCDYVNQLGFIEFYEDDDNYYYVNINITNALYGITIFNAFKSYFFLNKYI